MMPTVLILIAIMTGPAGKETYSVSLHPFRTLLACNRAAGVLQKEAALTNGRLVVRTECLAQ